MTEAEKIGVIMHEYDTLRDEIVQRNNTVQQQTSIAVLVLFGALSILSSGTPSMLAGIVLGAIVLLAAGLFTVAMCLAQRDIKSNATRLREIECEVNARSEEPLLQWECYWGGGATGNLYRKPDPRARPESMRKFAE